MCWRGLDNECACLLSTVKKVNTNLTFENGYLFFCIWYFIWKFFLLSCSLTQVRQFLQKLLTKTMQISSDVNKICSMLIVGKKIPSETWSFVYMHPLCMVPWKNSEIKIKSLLTIWNMGRVEMIRDRVEATTNKQDTTATIWNRIYQNIIRTQIQDEFSIQHQIETWKYLNSLNTLAAKDEFGFSSKFHSLCCKLPQNPLPK